MCFLSFLFLFFVGEEHARVYFPSQHSIFFFFLSVTTYGATPCFFFFFLPEPPTPLWQLLFSPFCVCVFRNCFQKREGLGQSHRTVSRRKTTLLSFSEDNHFIWAFQKKKKGAFQPFFFFLTKGRFCKDTTTIASANAERYTHTHTQSAYRC